MSLFLHVRFTPDDISGYTFDFLDCNEVSKYVIAYEEKDKSGAKVPPHYHIYVETSYGEQTFRNLVKSNLKIPVSGKGKNNKYYGLQSNWKDKDYIFKWGDIKKSKGFSEEEIQQRVAFGRGKYLKTCFNEEVGGNSPAGIGVQPPAKVKGTDKDIIADGIYFYETYKRDFGVPPEPKELIREICKAIRSYGKGINIFKVRDIVHAVWYDTEDNKDFLINKISGIL